MVYALYRYFLDVFSQGEYQSDWLTHMPTWLAQVAQALGYLLASLLGI